MAKKKAKITKERKSLLKKADYDKLHQTAYELVVIQGHDQKEVSKTLNLTEQTLSKWSTEGKWREQREARQQCSSTDADNTKKLLRLLSTQRLELEESISISIKDGNKEEEARLRKQASSLSDEMSKINKTLQSLDKKNYTLGVYIDVMDEIFSALRGHDEEIWNKTIDFQALHIRKVTNQIG